MKIAVACEGLRTSPHAAHCDSFMCYTVTRGIIADCQNLPNPNVAGDELAQLLKELGMDVLITAGIDMDTANALCYAGVEVVAGPEGTAREVVDAYLSRTLIGVDSLCHTYGALEAAEAEEDDAELDAAFARIEAELKLTAQ
ncbi:MAG: hypothetical protein IJC51_01305 [Eggerthellaceae bacterium]|nr:hypothetical protein [Eggerthellaceae bacterium]